MGNKSKKKNFKLHEKWTKKQHWGASRLRRNRQPHINQIYHQLIMDQAATHNYLVIQLNQYHTTNLLQTIWLTINQAYHTHHHPLQLLWQHISWDAFLLLVPALNAMKILSR